MLTIEEAKKDSGLLMLTETSQYFWGEKTGIREVVSFEPWGEHTISVLKDKLNNLRTISPRARDILVQMGFRVYIKLDKVVA